MSAPENRFDFSQLMQMDACTRCGQCQEGCDAYTGEENTSPRYRLNLYRRWLKSQRLPRPLAALVGGRHLNPDQVENLTQGVFRCTLCSRCREVCPVKIDTLGLWYSMREELVAGEMYPRNLDKLREGVDEEHNVYNYPNDERATWLDFMDDAPEGVVSKPTADVIYFVGCVASYSPAIQSIPQAMAQLLVKTGMDFTIMGEEEWCCGFPLFSAGMGQAASEVISHNLEKVKDIGARTMVFTCPSCFRTWREYYQQHLPGVEMVHSTQLLERVFKRGELSVGRFPHKVAYHDPCDLGRNSGVYQAPRQALRAIPGLALVEIEQHGNKAHCCGGGGDLEVSDPDLGTAISVNVLGIVQRTGAEVLVTACQQCKRMFLNAEAQSYTGIKVMDITEIALEASDAANE
ncbi:MAG: (Fe-S)-binding protein [Dehalococcoidia bacterium]|jgi:heterodisulfide reductase subunit D|nr:(Fe-S)-binding protein [Dehalococcoidia bacterium]